ncbi:hemolysin III family protein, partial [Bacillus safensis]
MTKSATKKKTTLETFKEMSPLSFGEEVGNSVSHGVAAFIMLLTLPYAAV